MRTSVVGLVGVTGFAGAGKTTAAMHLSKLTRGWYLYLGQTVLDEVRRRGLPETRDYERQVRIDLRRERGAAALAIPYVDMVAERLGRGIPVFVDAIFAPEEYEVLVSRIQISSARLLAIDTSFATRLTRLASRAERPLNADELQRRDKTEVEQLRTDAVIAAAKHKICNEGTVSELYQALAGFVSFGT